MGAWCWPCLLPRATVARSVTVVSLSLSLLVWTEALAWNWKGKGPYPSQSAVVVVRQIFRRWEEGAAFFAFCLPRPRCRPTGNPILVICNTYHVYSLLCYFPTLLRHLGNNKPTSQRMIRTARWTSGETRRFDTPGMLTKWEKLSGTLHPGSSCRLVSQESVAGVCCGCFGGGCRRHRG